jgi:CubicO group peptidase (beta-lactamase class C family)
MTDGLDRSVLSPAAPEQLGLSAERLRGLSKRLYADVAEGVLPGAVLLIARKGKIALFEAVGSVDPKSRSPMLHDAIFRIYSMTKPFTSVAAMMLVEGGKIALSDAAAKYIPTFDAVRVGVERSEGKSALDIVSLARMMTVHDLLRHTSGLTYGGLGSDSLVKAAYRDAKLLDDDPDNAEFANRIAKLPLMFQPGTTWEYSHATDILGRVVEVVSGISLGEFLRDRLFDPLGMHDTGFYVADPAKHNRIAEPFEHDSELENGATMFDPRQRRRWESGGGGAVGTAMDYARFLQMLLDGGVLGGTRLLSPKTVAYMTSDHVGDGIAPGPTYLPGPGYGFGLGFAVRRSTGLAAFPGTIGDYRWGGIGGTSMWVDPAERLIVVFMVQSPRHRLPYRDLLRNLIYAAVAEEA